MSRKGGKRTKASINSITRANVVRADEPVVIKKKIVLLGDSAVGKTSLIRRFVYDHFDDSYIATVGSKVTKKGVQVQRPDGSVKLSLMIWDLIGREGYAAFHSRSLVGTQGALLVSDLTREETLGSLERYWIPLLFKVVGNVPLVFASNKSDLKDEFEFKVEDLEDVASRFNKGAETILPRDLSTCYSTSAKNGSEVENAFASLAHLTLSEKKPEDPLVELFEKLVATRVRRTSDTSTPIGALDAIIVDFCDGFENQKLAMAILRLEITRAGIDVKSPTKEGILKAIDYLADAELEFMDRDAVVKNRTRRLKFLSHLEQK